MQQHLPLSVALFGGKIHVISPLLCCFDPAVRPSCLAPTLTCLCKRLREPHDAVLCSVLCPRHSHCITRPAGFWAYTQHEARVGCALLAISPSGALILWHTGFNNQLFTRYVERWTVTGNFMEINTWKPVRNSPTHHSMAPQ